MSLYLLELKESNHELAVAEARAVGEVIEEGYGYAVVREPRVTRQLGASHRVSRYLGRSGATVEKAVEKARELDVSLDGSFAVRARVHGDNGGDGDGVSSTELERRVGGVFAERAPVNLDAPDDVVRLIVSEGNVFFGLHVCETEGFEGRAPTEKPFFKPGSMSPVLARTLSNIAGGYDGATVLDPTCGTGGVLVESALAGGRAVGGDASREMVEGARTNLREFCEDADGRLFVGDARSLPLCDGSVDCAVTDLPYGRASHVEGESPETLARSVLGELRRVVRSDGEGRVVAVSDGWLDETARDAGFDVVERVEDRVHRSLTRRVVVLDQ
ncbi:MAG: methyltransferase domain-containing protein [Halobacteriales archaeon]|nr:methyltransferase domain-containing protein [Halobacteriales archaeon]